MQKLKEDLAQEFLNAVSAEWESTIPENDKVEHALQIIRSLRKREEFKLGFSKKDIDEVRKIATKEEIKEASSLFENALRSDLFLPYHTNAFASLGPTTLNLAIDSNKANQLLEKLLENHLSYGENRWGFGETTSICDLISYLWKNSDIDDITFLPLFCWLLRQSKKEWEMMGKISETSLGNAGHNWWIDSYYGFWFAGFFFELFKDLKRFKHLVPNYLESELDLLFGEDGWSIEEAPNYHIFAARRCFKIDELARLNNFKLGKKLDTALKRMASALWKIIAPDLEYPGFADSVIGDSYQGFDNYKRPDLNNRVYLKKISAMYKESELKYILEKLNKETNTSKSVWSYLGKMESVYKELEAQAPNSTDSSLDERGLYAMRDSWEPDSNYLAIQAGLGGAAECSHKQSDIFNFELYSHGDRAIVDNWYGPSREMSEDRSFRKWRISTDAHNTVSIDGKDQLEQMREFRYKNIVKPYIQAWESTPEYSYFHGVHDAYKHLHPHSVPSHRRKIFFLKKNFWILIDRLMPATDFEHEYNLLFHLKPNGKVLNNNEVITEGNHGNVKISTWCNKELNVELKDNPYPWIGYENPQYLRFSAKSKEPVIFVTVIIPFKEKNIPQTSIEYLKIKSDERILDPWEGTALKITDQVKSFQYVDLHTHWILPWTVGNMNGDQRKDFQLERL